MTIRLMMMQCLALWLLCMSTVAAAQSTADKMSVCESRNERNLDAMRSSIRARLTMQHPDTVLLAGKAIFDAMPDAERRRLMRFAKRADAGRRFHGDVDNAIGKHFMAREVRNCPGSDVEHAPFLTFEHALSVVGTTWRLYDTGNRCTGVCETLAAFGPINATEKIKRALYAYLYSVQHPDRTETEIVSVLSAEPIRD